MTPERRLMFVVNELFRRLFAVAAKMKDKEVRTFTELFVTVELDNLKKQRSMPDRAGMDAPIETIEFFVKNPDLFDPDLRKWVDLERLLKAKREGPEEDLLPSIEQNRKRRKLPSRNPGSPSPVDRRKKPKSS
jgi:hypothetical protein